MATRTIVLTFCLLLCSELPAFSQGSTPNKGDPWDPRHIDNLPVEIRDYIAGVCKGPPRARNDFATYNPNEKRWRINLEYLQCNGLGAFRRGNQCLDVDFVAAGSHYRLARKSYAGCGF